MRRKLLTTMIVLGILVSSSVGARSLVNMSLGFGAAYSPLEDVDYSVGMQNSENWMFGGELSARFAFLQAQAMAFPVVCSDDEQGVLLLGMGAVSVPMIGSALALELGAGASVIYMPTSSASSKAYYELADGTTVEADQNSLADAMLESPVYLQVGLGSELGPIGFKVRYLMQSSATLGSVLTNNDWWGVFGIEKASLSLALALKMF